MPFERFVETGRVAYISDGPNKGKLCAIVDVIDQTRVLVDGPETGVSRGQLRLNQIFLTKFKISFPFSGCTRVVRKAWKEGQVDEKWKSSLWAQRLDAKTKRVAMNDFDRFKLRRAKRVRNKIRTSAFYKVKKYYTRNGLMYGMQKKKKKDVKMPTKRVRKEKGGVEKVAKPAEKK